jgi:hypothetical protein
MAKYAKGEHGCAGCALCDDAIAAADDAVYEAMVREDEDVAETCPACGFVEYPNRAQTSAEAAHEDNCCGADTGCSWEPEDRCITHIDLWDNREGNPTLNGAFG